MRDLRALVANDSHAATFQSLGQYRTALLREIDASAPAGAQPMASVCLVTNRNLPHFAAAEIQLYGGYEPKVGDRLHLAPQDTARDREDAERYRWLRDEFDPSVDDEILWLSGDSFDAAIDAARGAGGGG
ncbi:hypothetical protein [Lysobacter enzymogenes]|nr:hypothetical protein [Lysobacter enzymogenes]SDY08313.1 hypothetical protein SAMN05421681_110188 [Lysobacter enzymogenes]